MAFAVCTIAVDVSIVQHRQIRVILCCDVIVDCRYPLFQSWHVGFRLVAVYRLSPGA